MVGGCACVFVVGSVDIAGNLQEAVSIATAVLYGSWVSCCSLAASGHGSPWAIRVGSNSKGAALPEVMKPPQSLLLQMA